jgi:uncharacterized membrane protein YhaH (DUF805 family)
VDCHLTHDISTNPYQTPGASSAVSLPKPSVKDILFSFSGRIPRRIYWLWSIVSTIVVVIALVAVMMVFGTPVDPENPSAEPGLSPIGTILMLILYVPLVWIGLALGVKRWHDRDKSGWWILIGMIPLVGAIWTFVECGCLRGTVGPNNYGEDPT